MVEFSLNYVNYINLSGIDVVLIFNTTFILENISVPFHSRCVFFFVLNSLLGQ